jgi:hypothetical protein
MSHASLFFALTVKRPVLTIMELEELNTLALCILYYDFIVLIVLNIRSLQLPFDEDM